MQLKKIIKVKATETYSDTVNNNVFENENSVQLKKNSSKRRLQKPTKKL